MIDVQIVDIEVQNIKFLTSVKRARKNATNPDPNYSCIYVTIKANEKYEGYGIGEGKDKKITAEIVKDLFNEILRDQRTTEIYAELGSVWKRLSTRALTWLGGDQNIYPAAVAIMNALWDLWARIEDKPVWKLLTDMTPEQFITTVDFSNAMDAITPTEALQMLTEKEEARENYEKILKEHGYPASATGIGYYDNQQTYKGFGYQRMRDLSRNFKKLNFTTFEVYADQATKGSFTRCHVMNKMIGCKKRKLVLNTSEITWKLDHVFNFLNNLRTDKKIKLYCIKLLLASYKSDADSEEAIESLQICMNLSNIKTCSGEECKSHVKFKELVGSCLPHIWQININGIGGLNEALIVYLMAHKMQLPVWLYGDGLGLDEMGQHVQMWDFVCLSQTTENRVIEFVNYQHGYFENPVYIRNACYMPPTRPGFSTKLKAKCISRWSYPEGTQWINLLRLRNLESSDSDIELEQDTDTDDMEEENVYSGNDE